MPAPSWSHGLGNDVPPIEADLRRTGLDFLDSDGENRAALAAFAREAIGAGMTPQAVAHVSGVPLEDIEALAR